MARNSYRGTVFKVWGVNYVNYNLHSNKFTTAKIMGKKQLKGRVFKVWGVNYALSQISSRVCNTLVKT